MMRSANMRMGLAAAGMVLGLGCGEMPPADIEMQSSELSEVGVGGLRGVYFFSDFNGHTQYMLYPQAGSKRVTVRSHDLSGGASVARTVSATTTTCAAWGYSRVDTANAVVYIDTAGHVHDVTNAFDPVNPSVSWDDTDLRFLVNAPLASTASGCEIFAVTRADAVSPVSSIIYRGTDNHIYELKSNFQSSPLWVATDLTRLNAGTPSVGRGNPVPYFRRGDLAAIVWVGTDNHIHELKGNFNGAPKWLHTDLSVAAGETVTAASGAWPTQRGDHVDTVVFVGSESTPKLHELSNTGGSPCGRSWCSSILPTTRPVSASERPASYDGRGQLQAGVVYLSPVSGSQPTLRHMALQNGAWSDQALTLVAPTTTAPVNITAMQGSLEYMITYTRRQVAAPNDARGTELYRGFPADNSLPGPWQTFAF